MSWELDEVGCQCHLHVPVVSHRTNTQNYMTAVVLPDKVDSLLSCAGLSAPRHLRHSLDLLHFCDAAAVHFDMLGSLLNQVVLCLQCPC